MPSYSNGHIPLELLVTFERGYNGIDGHWHHSLSAATYARHRALVAAAKRRTGRDLRISSGWSAYRPYDAQVLARRIHGNYAAMPGTSSHGGFWEGRQTLAMDYGNWAAVYSGFGFRDAFAADCRSVGLSPNLIVPARGYPDEPWHVVDLNPWSAVPAFAGATDFPTTTDPEPEPEEEDDDMAKNSGFFYERSRDKATVYLLTNTATGWWMEYLPSTAPGANNAIAATLDTGSFAKVTEIWATAMKNSLPRSQGVVVSGSLTVAGDSPS